MDDETKFLLKRAYEEATLAIKAEGESASDAHQEMAIRYSAKALAQLSNAGPEAAKPAALPHPLQE